jgi:hypothetical protein
MRASSKIDRQDAKKTKDSSGLARAASRDSWRSWRLGGELSTLSKSRHDAEGWDGVRRRA